jgi:dTDP-4-dehydrorhamnose 3,5-epimerase
MINIKLSKFEKHSDGRGDLVVFLKNKELEDIHKNFGQIYFVTFKKKGTIRGNHYHKKWKEWFGIISGKTKVLLKDVKTGDEKKLILNAASKRYRRLEIGPYIAHTFVSLSDYAAIINYADAPWSDMDDYDYKLI